ncbi:TPA: site-specific DNA-methyltransferase, partial [Escherichia coli]|nr:site-specific DNA-methyltransferase [Escherichia coli]
YDWVTKNKKLTGGEQAYKYIDEKGRVYQSVSLRAPEPRTDKKFYIPLIHPVTGKPCAMPPNGFSRTPETLKDMMDKGDILFGVDETTQPRQKAYLYADAKKQITSIIQDAKKGKTQTTHLGI